MLIKPIITEKTVAQMGINRYYFRVNPGSTKTEIKKGVEKLFKVNVLAIRTAIMPGKKYRSGRRWMIRQRSDWKKAVVTLKPGQKIELVDVPGAEVK
jgi:large subunit ribosomal protein L23